MRAAQARLVRYRNFAVLRYQQNINATEHLAPLELLPQLENDLNTPLALAALEAWLNQIELSNRYRADEITKRIQLIDALLGLKLESVPDISDQQKQLINEREHARSDQDWAKADALRAQHEQTNITVLDRPDGPIWQYLS